MQYKEKYSLSLGPEVTFLSLLLFNASAIASALKLTLGRKASPLLQVLSKIKNTIS